MLTAGDLVEVKLDAFAYFAGRLALVSHTAHIEEYYDDAGKLQTRTYYLVTLADNTASHVLPEDSLILVSKAQSIND